MFPNLFDLPLLIRDPLSMRFTLGFGSSDEENEVGDVRGRRSEERLKKAAKMKEGGERGVSSRKKGRKGTWYGERKREGKRQVKERERKERELTTSSDRDSLPASAKGRRAPSSEKLWSS